MTVRSLSLTVTDTNVRDLTFNLTVTLLNVYFCDCVDRRGVFTKSIPEDTRTITVPSLSGL